MIDAAEARANRRDEAQDLLDNVIDPAIREASVNDSQVVIYFLDKPLSLLMRVAAKLHNMSNPFRVMVGVENRDPGMFGGDAEPQRTFIKINW